MIDVVEEDFRQRGGAAQLFLAFGQIFGVVVTGEMEAPFFTVGGALTALHPWNGFPRNGDFQRPTFVFVQRFIQRAFTRDGALQAFAFPLAGFFAVQTFRAVRMVGVIDRAHRIDFEVDVFQRFRTRAGGEEEFQNVVFVGWAVVEIRVSHQVEILRDQQDIQIIVVPRDAAFRLRDRFLVIRRAMEMRHGGNGLPRFVHLAVDDELTGGADAGCRDHFARRLCYRYFRPLSGKTDASRYHAGQCRAAKQLHEFH